MKTNSAVSQFYLITGTAWPLIARKFQFQNWELTISRVDLSDGGEYLCQATTHPPLAIITHLDVVGRRGEEGTRISMLLQQYRGFSNNTRQIVLQCHYKSASQIYKEKMRSQIISLLLLSLLLCPLSLVNRNVS